ncbi:PPM-type phosphatase domain [Arabidopsis thaliana x Arabidopsis arenosa]|uniref:protein-serine/threonine phosphatase n=1 Tax=Arabidopsis thaliana x Arabidopsis arenosa TaxID=1240361 RepID=A0A8T1YSL9_9BRAS|nr:PPM-type phosphatase domain [Arabidopsis thaliana x Arabidopsis arenosa]
MGVCCSKGTGIIVEHGTDDSNEYGNGEAEVRDTNDGAVVRTHGSSKHVSMSIKQGKKGINQDAMTVWENFGGEEDMIFCGVFDGHGPMGHKISRHVCENLPSRVHSKIRSSKSGGNENVENNSSQSQEELFREFEDILVTFFKQIDSELGLDSPYDSFCSGTTAVTVFKQADCLVIANLGDSRAVLGTRSKNSFKAVQLTVDLKPCVQREAERIVACKGRVFAMEEEPEVYRVWMPDDDCPGLAMSRAFGDFCLKDYGLVCIPDVFCRKVSREDEFVVLATDGIWDVLSNEEVVKVVGSCKDRTIAAETLVQRAARTWRTKFPASKADDCAVVVLYLNHRPYPREGNVSRAISTISWRSNKSNNECYGVAPLGLPQRVS